ncbi:hypothetical protein MY4824_005908 [Beauveria thailandica]
MTDYILRLAHLARIGTVVDAGSAVKVASPAPGLEFAPESEPPPESPCLPEAVTMYIVPLPLGELVVGLQAGARAIEVEAEALDASRKLRYLPQLAD